MIKVYRDQESLAQGAATLFIDQFKKMKEQTRGFNVVLSGGQTPLQTYALLASPAFRNHVDWSRMHVFWGDERCVDPTDERSNFGRADQVFLAKLPIPREQIHPMFRSGSAQKSAEDYETMLRKHFDPEPPFFGFVFLGLGLDGHTASLFPGSPSLQEKTRWILPVQHEPDPFERLTMTAELLNRTHQALFLVTGREKAALLKKILTRSETPADFPAKLVQPVRGTLSWFMDSAAAGGLDLGALSG